MQRSSVEVSYGRAPLKAHAVGLSEIGPLIRGVMWVVYEHRRVARQIKSIPIDILKRYEKWKDIINVSGPDGLRLIKEFHDESLRGEWKGFRSSRLGRQFRVINKAERNQVLVQVVNINAHDYRKK